MLRTPLRKIRALTVAALIASCCHATVAQDRAYRPLRTEQVLGADESSAQSSGNFAAAAGRDDLRLQVQRLSAEVRELRRIAGQASKPQTNGVRPAVFDGSNGADTRGGVVPASAQMSSYGKAMAEPNKPWLQGKFDNGWQLRSADGNFVLKPDVEVNLDAVWLTADDALQYDGPGAVGPVSDGINVRRGRIGAKGTIYGNFAYMIQYDLNLATTVRNSSGTSTSVINSPQPTEIWGMFRNLPYLRNVRIGNQKPLWSFENFTSSRFQNFMERSFGWDAFTEDQNNGFIPSIVMLNHTDDERFVYQVGVAKNNRSGFFYNTQAGNYLVQGRLVTTPWYKENGRFLLHLGVGGMYADTDNGIARFRARTLLRNASNQQHPILTEARMYADRESRVVPEFVLQLGSLSIQAEYYMAWASNARTIAGGSDGPSLGTWFGNSYYVQVNYLLTGEHVPYDRKLARWGRIVPNHNFSTGCDQGLGAWMIGVRYSTIDLNDLGGVNGAGATPAGYTPSSAKVDDVSICLNWIVNPNARMLFDGILEHRNTANTPASDGNVYGFGMRLQFDY